MEPLFLPLDLTPIFPPCNSTIFLVINNPNPEPSDMISRPCPYRSIFPNCENNLFFSSEVIPIPLSCIEIKIESSVMVDLIFIFPLGGVYFIALLIKLLITR